MNISILHEYEAGGWLMSQTHPIHPLIIWNYTAKTQYEGKWDDITLKCRGLVTDTEGNIVSKGFDKFFNYEENRHVATEKFDVYEKMDGQYIGVFWYQGEMIVNSRGSFTSKYAIEAKRILDEKYSNFKEFGCYYESFEVTHCFELIGFEQIVVSYPESDLICTGVFRNDGIEGWKDLSLEHDEETPKSVKKYDGFDYKNIKQLNWKNREGFVVKFSNGQRCKIKFDEYVQLHRKMTNLSTTSIWEAMRTGKPVSDILETTPDEFFEKVKYVEFKLNYSYKTTEESAIALFELIKMTCGHDTSRKKFAEICLQTLRGPLVSKIAIMFDMYDGKDYSQKIWKTLKPKFEKI